MFCDTFHSSAPLNVRFLTRHLTSNEKYVTLRCIAIYIHPYTLMMRMSQKIQLSWDFIVPGKKFDENSISPPMPSLPFITSKIDSQKSRINFPAVSESQINFSLAPNWHCLGVSSRCFNAFDKLRRTLIWNNSFQTRKEPELSRINGNRRFLIDESPPMGIDRKTFMKAKLRSCSKGSFYSKLFHSERYVSLSTIFKRKIF